MHRDFERDVCIERSFVMSELRIRFMLRPITRAKLYKALRVMGRDWLLPRYRKAWTPLMPTTNYCWCVTELIYRYLLKRGSGFLPYRVKTGYNSYHYYLMNPEARLVIDLTADQFYGDLPDYTKGKRALFYPAISLRTRELAKLLGLKRKRKC